MSDEAQADQRGRPLEELRDSGLLWLINRVVFHPRGVALALELDDRQRVVGWNLIGDGSAPWSFPSEVDDELFAKAETTLREVRRCDRDDSDG